MQQVNDARADVVCTCFECGHDVRRLAGTNRTREIERGVNVLIPNDFLIPTCESCGEEYMDLETSIPLDNLLRETLNR